MAEFRIASVTKDRHDSGRDPYRVAVQRSDRVGSLAFVHASVTELQLLVVKFNVGNAASLIGTTFSWPAEDAAFALTFIEALMCKERMSVERTSRAIGFCR